MGEDPQRQAEKSKSIYGNEEAEKVVNRAEALLAELTVVVTDMSKLLLKGDDNASG